MEKIQKGDPRLANFTKSKPVIEELMRMFDCDPRDMRVLTQEDYDQERKNNNCKNYGHNIISKN